MAKTESIRVLLAENTKRLRARIRKRLKMAKDIEIVAEAYDMAGALEQARAHALDVILINDFLPPMENGHAAVSLRQEGVAGSILAFASRLEPESLQHSFRREVNGFLHTNEIDDHLASAVRNVCRGERFFSPEAKKIYLDD